MLFFVLILHFAVTPPPKKKYSWILPHSYQQKLHQEYLFASELSWICLLSTNWQLKYKREGKSVCENTLIFPILILTSNMPMVIIIIMNFTGTLTITISNINFKFTWIM